MTERAVGRECINRPSRLGAVWLTYRTRWLVWILVFGIGFLTVFVAWNFGVASQGGMNSAVPATPNPQPSGNFFPGLVNGPTDWRQLRTLSISGLDECQPLWNPGAIPRLEALTVFDAITDGQLAEICRLYELKSLALYDISALTPTGFSSIKN